ncbi:hypothetical protein JCM31826_03240 [Thermaurantimonas aggregans]|uniref:Lipoprotein n=1 Tax=Thermaurantimonas aggregans TaxID=2173829 RepID=A0A401XIJ4_9FLAO|nr:hypothetical protein [Thermaurantimonas aggregans]MCX8148785.1 hypothetical protein [Thermaurantimonas aggregans]GCD76842.1 hypothetical protein JCM31826_03240 [Thermaurantimonas aggregans]
MKNFLHAGALALAILFSSCSSSINVEDGDTLTVYVNNYSVKDFEPYLDCSTVLSKNSADHKKLVKLIADLSDETFEEEDGSNYYTITITDATGIQKATVTIPQGGGGRSKSKKLFQLLDQICIY